MDEVDEQGRQQIREACREVAFALLGRGRASFADADLVERLTDVLLAHACTVAMCTNSYEAGVIARAIRYLGHAHATGQLADHPHYVIENTAWFKDMLMALVELACPNGGTPPSTDAFFKDVEQGIADYRSAWEDGNRP